MLRILSFNPGSTSTKLGVFDDGICVLSHTIRHKASDFAGCDTIMDQAPIRYKTITDTLSEKGFALESFDAFVGRGGIIAPVESGVYTVNETMLKDLRSGSASKHASALGGIFAHELGQRYGKPAFIVDPVVVDERVKEAKLTGIPEAEKTSVFHALNQKSIAREYARKHDTRYEDCCLVVAHLGGGISVGAHSFGKVIDVNNAIDGDGPFSPERCGSIEVDKIVKMCFSGKYTEAQMHAFSSKAGGLVAYFGTSNCLDVENMALGGDEKAQLVLKAMCYAVAKQIGAMCVALKGKVDAIILTGGLAYGKLITDTITEYVGFMAPVEVYPGEDELLALASGAMRVITGQEEPKEYRG
ncbi:MAG: butyrate kinase [Clostridia bacterium]|nr:butyrate kinase [Clostridia bacterium]